MILEEEEIEMEMDSLQELKKEPVKALEQEDTMLQMVKVLEQAGKMMQMVTVRVQSKLS